MTIIKNKFKTYMQITKIVNLKEKQYLVSRSRDNYRVISPFAHMIAISVNSLR